MATHYEVLRPVTPADLDENPRFADRIPAKLANSHRMMKTITYEG